jgi:hypothetical protein
MPCLRASGRVGFLLLKGGSIRIRGKVEHGLREVYVFTDGIDVGIYLTRGWM